MSRKNRAKQQRQTATFYTKVDNFFGGVCSPQRKGDFFLENGQRNVTYMKHVALWCGCSIPAAEWARLQWVLYR